MEKSSYNTGSGCEMKKLLFLCLFVLLHKAISATGGILFSKLVELNTFTIRYGGIVV